MQKLIQIKDAKVSLDSEKFIKNINLTFYRNNNVCIYSKNNYDSKLCDLLIDTLMGNNKLVSGEIVFDRQYDINYFLEFNNLFKRLLNEDITFDKVINSLFRNQKLSNDQIEEIYTFIKLLSLDNYYNSSINKLDYETKKLVNLVFFLIVKPQIIFVKSINFFNEATPLLFAVCSYLKSYLEKYNISLIMNVNNDKISNSLFNRFIEIKNNIIHADNEVVIKSEINKNIVDNRTKAFDLDSELLNISNHKTSKMNSTSNFSEPVFSTQFQNNEFNHKMPKFNNQPSPKPNQFNRNGFSFNNIDKGNSDNFHAKTEELKFDSESLIEEIKLTNKTAQLNVNKTSNLIINQDEIENDDEIKKDLITTYNIRRQLEQQIKSPDFSNLSIELQNKVFENYDRANDLINEHDPYGKYDPNKTSNLRIFNDESEDQEDSFNITSGFTNKILTDELDDDFNEVDDNFKNRDQRLERIYSSKTSNIDTDVYDSLNEDIEDEDIDADLTYHNRLFNRKTSKATNNFKIDTNEFNDSDFEPRMNNRNELKTSDIELHNNIYTKKFEPTSYTKELNKISRNDFDFEPKKTKKATLRTEAIKKRNKRNKIEEIYAEAIADEELIKDQFDNDR